MRRRSGELSGFEAVKGHPGWLKTSSRDADESMTLRIFDPVSGVKGKELAHGSDDGPEWRYRNWGLVGQNAECCASQIELATRRLHLGSDGF